MADAADHLHHPRDHSGAVFSPAMTSIMGMMCGGFDQMHADDAARHSRARLNARDRDARGVGREDALLGHMRFRFSRKHLNLEVEIFGHGLDDEFGARNAWRQTAVNGDIARV